MLNSDYSLITLKVFFSGKIVILCIYISMYISFTMTIQNFGESINYFREKLSIRTLILINFTDNI